MTVKNIVSKKTLDKMFDDCANEETLFRIVEMMDKTYNIHRVLYKGDVYFLGIEGDHGMPLIASTDPFHTIKVMEDFIMDDISMYMEVGDESVMVDGRVNPKYLIN